MRRFARPPVTARAVLGTALGGAALLALGACSTELPVFTAAQVADAVAEEVATASATPDPIECGTLAPEEGASASCTYTLGDRTQDADVTVTSVVDEDVQFTVEVTRTYLTADQLTALVAEQRAADAAAGEVVCLDPLDLDEGARAYCAQVEGETSLDLAVTADSGAGDPVLLQIEVDDRAASESGQ